MGNTQTWKCIFNCMLCLESRVTVTDCILPTEAMRGISGVFPGSPQGQEEIFGCQCACLSICVLFLGQWVSIVFDRTSVSSGVGFGAREAELVGLKAHTLSSIRASQLLLFYILQPHASLFFKSTVSFSSNTSYSSFRYKPSFKLWF